MSTKIACQNCGSINELEKVNCVLCGMKLDGALVETEWELVENEPDEQVGQMEVEKDEIKLPDPDSIFGCFSLVVVILLLIWAALIQPMTDRAKEEKARQAKEAQYAQEVADYGPYCYDLFNQWYAPYLDGGTISFNIPCYSEDDLWEYSGGYSDGSASFYQFRGGYSQEMYLVTIQQGSHLVMKGNSNTSKQIQSRDGYDRFLVFSGKNIPIGYEEGFEPTPEPTESPESYIWVDVPNERYNSAGCIAYRLLGGSSGLGGVNTNNPNDDPQCNYPTHQEKQYIGNP